MSIDDGKRPPDPPPPTPPLPEKVEEPVGSKTWDTPAEQHQDPTPASPDDLDAVVEKPAESPSAANFRENRERGREFEAAERVRFKDQWSHAGDPGHEVATPKGKYDRKAGEDVPTDRRGRIDNRVHDQENDIVIINEVKATNWSQYDPEKEPWKDRADAIARQVNSYIYGELSKPEGAEWVQPYVTFENPPRDPKNTDSVNEKFTQSIVDRFGEHGIHVEWAKDDGL